MALEQREGPLFGGSSWFNWHTPEDINRLFSESGLNVRHLRGIGVFSGIEGDPLSFVVRPSQLTTEEQESLMKIECAAAEQYAACGRYILATVENPPVKKIL